MFGLPLPSPLLAAAAFLAYRHMTNAPPFGSTPPQVKGTPVYAKVRSKSGRVCETWTWSAPVYGFVARCGRDWISVTQQGAVRVPAKTNSSGAALEALRADWL
jgi:hypothetical protein